MSGYTPNLHLFKYNPDTDGKEVFSLTQALNNNWDVLDERCGSQRNIGEIVASTIPLTDTGLHLLDGALIQGSGIYADFVSYIASIYSSSASCFCTESEWQQSITNYGVCGKFVYDSTNNTVRLPKVTGIIEGTTDLTALGDLVEAGLPNITAQVRYVQFMSSVSATGAFNATAGTSDNSAYSGNTVKPQTIDFDASRSSSIYGNSSTVQPQTIKAFYYIVIATSTKTDIQVDIDEVVTDLNGKADTDLSNVPNSKGILTESYVNGTSWYRVYSDGWCEQGGYIGSGSGNVTVTLLKAYRDTNYYANGCAITNNTGRATDGSVGVKTTTTCSFVNAGYTFPMLWECKGYIN